MILMCASEDFEKINDTVNNHLELLLSVDGVVVNTGIRKDFIWVYSGDISPAFRVKTTDDWISEVLTVSGPNSYSPLRNIWPTSPVVLPLLPFSTKP